MRSWPRTLLVWLFLLSSCSASAPPLSTVAIATTGCGFGENARGVGVVVAPDRVLTVAHVVSQADAITVSHVDQSVNADLVAFDRELDLALLAIGGLDDVSAANVAMPMRGSSVSIDTPTTRTTVDVIDVRPIRTEEVGGTDRFVRSALELGTTTDDGDSGAGVWNADGELVGIVFGHRTDEVLSYATSSAEIEAFLDQMEQDWSCNAAKSGVRLTAKN